MSIFVVTHPEESPMYQAYIFGTTSSVQSRYHQYWKLPVENTHFDNHLPREKSVHYYQKEKVEVLPGWSTTFGLPALKAIAMCRNLTVINYGSVYE